VLLLLLLLVVVVVVLLPQAAAMKLLLLLLLLLAAGCVLCAGEAVELVHRLPGGCQGLLMAIACHGTDGRELQGACVGVVGACGV
jgi:hypothetical protein